MAYAVAALCKHDGKRFTDMGPVNAAPAGTFFWVSFTSFAQHSNINEEHAMCMQISLLWTHLHLVVNIMIQHTGCLACHRHAQAIRFVPDSGACKLHAHV